MRRCLLLVLFTLVPALTVAQGVVRSATESVRVLCRRTTDAANTGSTSETKVWSCQVPANTLGNNAILEVHALAWNNPVGLNTNTGTCQWYARLNNADAAAGIIVAWNPAGQSKDRAVELWGRCAERNANNAQICGGHVGSNTNQFAVSGSSVGTGTYATSAAMYVVVSVVNSVAEDTCTLQMAEVLLYP